MKKLFLSSFLILAFCFAAFGQEAENLPCPTISVTGPTDITPFSEPVVFTANVSKEIEKFKPKYKWAISKGKIIQGQGTMTIKALQEVPMDMTAEITIEGLPDYCTPSAAVSLPICACGVVNLLDEFSISPLKVANEKLSELGKALQNDPSATASIDESFDRKTPRRTIERKLSKIFAYLGENWKLENERISIRVKLTDKNSTRHYVIPAGANTPDCEDCLTAKFTKTKAGTKVSLQPEAKKK